MNDDARVEELLERLLESGESPEDVCSDCPELLSRVRSRWRRLNAVVDKVDRLFPESTISPVSPQKAVSASDVPHIPGYEIRGELGRGGVGIVYRAWHLRLNRAVALKMLLAGQYAGPQELERFLREAEAVAGLHHANIVQVHDVGDTEGRPYFTMELIEGGSLADKLAGAPLPAQQAATLVTQLAEAVEAAHQCGIVHRDLKPSNILLAADGTPKVTDFGLARRLEGGGGLTLSGMPLGTPSYMAPEQARGDKAAVGPSVDIYALGAILYECLTGRPPFRGETAAITLQQVVANEPVPPARLNSRVPRNLQTICLKCLQKEPHKRYASALSLVEDLRRFQRGEPIKARAVGRIERAMLWVRRRPALAAALAAGLVLTSALAVTVLRWREQRTTVEAKAVAYAEADLSESERLRDLGEFETSAAVLQRAKDRLGEFVPSDLRDRLATAFAVLELVTRLDAIHVERAMLGKGFSLRNALVLTGADTKEPGQTPRGTQPGRRYEEAFRDAGLGAPGDDATEVAERVRNSSVRKFLVAALDDWGACAIDREQQSWVLSVARAADPDSWRDRVREPATWDDAKALRKLASEAVVDKHSPQLLAVLAARLRAKDIDAEEFLRRVASAYPGDFWVNVEMGNALMQSRPVEAIGYYRTALAARPKTAALHYTLSVLYFEQQRFEECRAHGAHAVHLAPDDAWYHTALACGLAARKDGMDDAIAEYREAIRLDPDLAMAHRNLAIVLELNGRLAEAVDEYRHALRLSPDIYAEDRRRLRNVLLKLRRWEEARRVWEQELASRPSDHGVWFGYAELCLFLGEEEAYRRACRDLLAQFGSTKDPDIAERVARACLLSAATDDVLRQAADLAGRAVAAGRKGHEKLYPFYLFTEGLACYREGRFDDAIKLMNGEAAVAGARPLLVRAMAQYKKDEKDQARKTLVEAVLSYEWKASEATDLYRWSTHVLRREAEGLILPNVQGFVEGRYQPSTNDERLALLGVCEFYDLHAAEARLYAAAFEADPKLTEEWRTGLRFGAACTAALAGCGGGTDGAALSDSERARWRRQALDWLRLDLIACTKALKTDTPVDADNLRKALARWKTDPDLAGVRDSQALEKLPADERDEWRALWKDLDALLETAPAQK